MNERWALYYGETTSCCRLPRSRSGAREMTSTMTSSTSPHADFDRYIDRFLFADGWRVTGVDRVTTPGLVAVTMTRTSETGDQSVTRSATSAGEAAFMACSSARRLGKDLVDAEA